MDLINFSLFSWLLIFLVTWLFYIFFGSIVDVVLGIEPSTQFLRIKIKIIFNTFIAPVLFALIIFFSVIRPDKPLLTILYALSLTTGILIRLFFKSRNYLTSFRLINSQMDMTYLTHFLRKGTDTFILADISAIEIANANWLIEYPASISIKHKNDYVLFELIDKKLKADIQNYLKVIAPAGTGKL